MKIVYSLLLTLLLCGTHPQELLAAESPQPDSITVYIFMHDDCLICRHYSIELNSLHQEYANEQLNFVGLFPNFASKPKAIEAFKETYSIPFELKTDYFRTITQKFEATVTPEVIVFNHDKEQVLYRGRIDNTYAALGKRRRSASRTELRDALAAIRKGEPIAVTNTKAIGCLINQNDRFSPKSK